MSEDNGNVKKTSNEDESAADTKEQTLAKDGTEKNEFDDKLNSFGKMLKKSLSGDVLAKDAIKSQTGVIILVAIILIFTTSNRYSCQQSHIKEAALKRELSEAKNKAFSSFSLLTEKSRRSKLIEGLKARNDSSLQIAEQPPYIVEIPQDETNDDAE